MSSVHILNQFSSYSRTLAVFSLLVLGSIGVLTGQQTESWDEKLLESLGSEVQGYVDSNFALGGELHVIQSGKTLYHKSFGLKEPQGEVAWENGTVCNIRSMTKPITSAAAQILIDRGKLDLDASVSKYLDAFDNDKSREITVRQVLTHRSGLPLTNLKMPYQFKSLQEQVADGATTGPEFDPGSRFWYSDLGTDVVGALVAKISGEPLHEFVKRELLDPLQMTETFYGIDASDPRLANVASGYNRGGPKGWMRFWKPGKRALYPFAWGSQTLYSTTTDYAKFLQMLMDHGVVGERQLLSKEAVERMMAPISRTQMMGSKQLMPTGFRKLESWYGQMLISYRAPGALDEDPEIISHSGSDGTIAWAWPKKDLLILYFTQSRGGVTPLRFEEKIDHWILQHGVEVKENVPDEIRPLLGTYVANYASFDGEEFVLKYWDGKLVLDVPSQLLFELVPNGDDVWGFAMAPQRMRVSFNRDENGTVGSINMHQGSKSFELPRKDD